MVFDSWATDLVRGDTNKYPDIFVGDLKTRKITRVNVSSSGKQAVRGICCFAEADISATGRYVTFVSQAANLVPRDTNGADVFAHDRRTGKTSRVSVSQTGTQSDNDSHYPKLSPDGRAVVFGSHAVNLVAEDTNQFSDVFIRTR